MMWLDGNWSCLLWERVSLFCRKEGNKYLWLRGNIEVGCIRDANNCDKEGYYGILWYYFKISVAPLGVFLPGPFLHRDYICNPLTLGLAMWLALANRMGVEWTHVTSEQEFEEKSHDSPLSLFLLSGDQIETAPSAWIPEQGYNPQHLYSISEK